MYCNYQLTTKVTALQVVRTSFQHSFISGLPRPCYFALPPMVLTLFMYSHVNDNVQPEGVKPILYSFVPLKKRLLLLVPGITDNKWNLKTGQCKAVHAD